MWSGLVHRYTQSVHGTVPIGEPSISNLVDEAYGAARRPAPQDIATRVHIRNVAAEVRTNSTLGQLIEKMPPLAFPSQPPPSFEVYDQIRLEANLYKSRQCSLIFDGPTWTLSHGRRNFGPKLKP